MLADLRRFWKLTSPGQRGRFTLLIVFMTIAAVMEMLGIGALLPILGVMQNPHLIETNQTLMAASKFLGSPSRQTFFINLLLGLFTFFVLKNIFLVFLDFFQYRFLAREVGKISTDLIKSYLYRPYTFHLETNTSELIRTVTTDASTLLYYVLIPAVVLTAEVLVIAALFLLIVFIELKAALFTILSSGALLYAFFRIFRERVYQIGLDVQDNSAKMIRYAQEGLGGIKEIKVMHREVFFRNAFSMYVQRYVEALSKSLITGKLPGHVIEAVFVAIFVGVLVFLTTLNRPTYAFPLLAVYAAAGFRLIPSLNRIMTSMNLIKQGGSSLSGIVAELEILAAADENSPPAHRLEFNREIRLIDVHYQYPTAEVESIKGVSLTINRGELVGVIGKSGSGKTTLIDNILGLLKPKSGSIVVDGVNIQENLRSWQMEIGYIPQQIYLTDDSLKKNIALGVEEHLIDVTKIWRVLDAARLTEFVRSLPATIDAMVGERGVRLSGGQRQRIGIARALYYDPEVIIMDEATSALDSETEKEIVSTINGLRRSKTIVIIAQRLSTIEYCDQVFMLSEGALVRSGKYHEVVGSAKNQ